jgi:hypothetical protein
MCFAPLLDQKQGLGKNLDSLAAMTSDSRAVATHRDPLGDLVSIRPSRCKALACRVRYAARADAATRRRRVFNKASSPRELARLGVDRLPSRVERERIDARGVVGLAHPPQRLELGLNCGKRAGGA